jgi:hypothetical protein
MWPHSTNAMLINFPLIPYSCSERAFGPCVGGAAVGERTIGGALGLHACTAWPMRRQDLVLMTM